MPSKHMCRGRVGRWKAHEKAALHHMSNTHIRKVSQAFNRYTVMCSQRQATGIPVLHQSHVPMLAQVVLQHLRPFAPMEVINTRVCSKASPAPGNTGFEGCLELLSLICRANHRALTIWDDAAFRFIDRAGNCSALQKQTMLPLPLPRVRFLVKNMRSFTICSQGQNSPQEVARAVVHLAGWGAKQVRGVRAPELYQEQ